MTPLHDLRARAPTGNAGPILREIATALARLLDTGQATTMDLGALPFSVGDEKALDAALGPGEVHATIEALGASRVSETGTPGVWRVDRFDQQGKRCRVSSKSRSSPRYSSARPPTPIRV